MKTLSRIALLGLVAVSPVVPSMLSMDQALAAGRPASPGNSEAAHESAGSDNANIASLAGGGNAAHASEQGLAHASDKSMVGKVREYATLDAALASGELQLAVTEAQNAFNLLYPTFAALTPAEQAVALASPAGVLLTAAQEALADATADRDAALAAITKSDDPAVKAYIDALLAN